MLSTSSYVADIWNIAQFGLLKLVFTVTACGQYCEKFKYLLLETVLKKLVSSGFFASAFSLNKEIECIARLVFGYTS